MKTYRPISIAVIVLAFAGLTPALSAHAAGEAEFEAGLDAAAQYRYAHAFELFRQAAEKGNVQAQRTAGLMALYGERLYGTEVPRNQAEAQKWLASAASGGCAVADSLWVRVALK
jgi:TPR repeat protein